MLTITATTASVPSVVHVCVYSLLVGQLRYELTLQVHGRCGSDELMGRSTRRLRVAGPTRPRNRAPRFVQFRHQRRETCRGVDGGFRWAARVQPPVRSKPGQGDELPSFAVTPEWPNPCVHPAKVTRGQRRMLRHLGLRILRMSVGGCRRGARYTYAGWNVAVFRNWRPLTGYGRPAQQRHA